MNSNKLDADFALIAVSREFLAFELAQGSDPQTMEMRAFVTQSNKLRTACVWSLFQHPETAGMQSTKTVIMYLDKGRESAAAFSMF